jgi:hypothetical protein
MWGYGAVVWLLDDKLLRLVVQAAAAVATLSCFIRVCERAALLPVAMLRLIRIAFVLLVPWHAYHALQWPYSISSSLFLVSFALLIQAWATTLAAKLRAKRLGACVLAGVLFGLGLNFRSDFYLFPIGILVLVWLLPAYRPYRLEALAWLTAAYVCLLPWGLYVKTATGQFSITSSNGGHVLFVGLGQLPRNKWGITPFDGDPVMLRELREHFGYEHGSLDTEANAYLTRRWLHLILEDPVEYGKKVAFGSLLTLTNGAYSGEFQERLACQPNCRELMLQRFTAVRDDGLPPGLLHRLVGVRIPPVVELISAQGASEVLTLASKAMSVLIVLVSYLGGMLLFALALQCRSTISLLVGAFICYQFALCAATYTIASYSSNILVFSPFVVALLSAKLQRNRQRHPSGQAQLPQSAAQ